jgi:hypothetical protein
MRRRRTSKRRILEGEKEEKEKKGKRRKWSRRREKKDQEGQIILTQLRRAPSLWQSCVMTTYVQVGTFLSHDIIAHL